MLFFILGLSCFSNINITSAQVEDDIDWDFSGLVKYQDDRVKFDSNNPFKLRYYYHLFYNEAIDASDTIVVLYGLRPVISAPYYSKFFDEGVTDTQFSYWINDSLDLEWVQITEEIFDKNSENYAPEYQTAYNEITNYTLFKMRDDIWDSNGKLKYPINFVNLSSITGEHIGMWQMIKRDGTIIRGEFTTYGSDKPLFIDEKSGLEWPFYNFSIAQDSYRSSLPRSHSFEVAFTFAPVLFAGIVFAVIVTFRKTYKRDY